MWMEFEPLRECLRAARRYMAVAGCRDRLAAMAGRRLTVPDVEQELRRQLAHAQQSGLGLVDIRADELCLARNRAEPLIEDRELFCQPAQHG